VTSVVYSSSLVQDTRKLAIMLSPPLPSFRLDGKEALITGAGRGIKGTPNCRLSGTLKSSGASAAGAFDLGHLDCIQVLTDLGLEVNGGGGFRY